MAGKIKNFPCRQTIYLEADTQMKLKEYCQEHHISISNFMGVLVDKELKQPSVDFSQLNHRLFKHQNNPIIYVRVYLEPQIVKQFKVYCYQHGLTVKQMVRVMLEQELKEQKLAKVLLADVHREGLQSLNIQFSRTMHAKGAEYASNNKKSLVNLVTALINEKMKEE